MRLPQPLRPLWPLWPLWPLSPLRPFGLLVIFICISAALLCPFLLRISFLNDGDTVGYAYPLMYFYSPATLFNGSMFWNPFNFHGFPSFIGDGASLAPLTHIARSVLPPLDALHWMLFFNVAVAGWLFALLLRRLGVSSLAALAAGTAYLAGTWWLAIHLPIANALPLLPALLLTGMEAKERPLPATLYGFLLLAVMWLSVHYHYIPYLLIAYAAVSLAVAWYVWKRGAGLHVYLRPLISAGFALLLSIPVALLRIIPAVFVYGPLSFRAGGFSASESALRGIEVGDLAQMFLPHFKFPFLPAGGAWLYLGVIGFALLLMGLADRRIPARVATMCYLVVLLICIPYSPLYPLIHSLPFFNMLHGQGRWMFLGNAAAAIVVGFGFERLVEGEEGKMKRIAVWLLWIMGIGAVIGGVAAFVLSAWHEPVLAQLLQYFDANFLSQTSGLPVMHYHAYITNAFHQALNTFSLLRPANVLAVASILVTAGLLSRRWKNRLGVSYAPVVAGAVVVTTVVGLFPLFPRLPLTEWPPQSQVAQFLKGKEGVVQQFLNGQANFLLLSTPHNPTEAERFRFNTETVGANSNILYGIPVADYYDGLVSRRMSRLLAWAGSEQKLPREDIPQYVYESIPVEEKIRILQQRVDMLSLLNIRYLVTAWELPGPFKQVFTTTVPPYGIPMHVYENAGARPHAYFADAVVTIPVDEMESFRVLSTQQWPGRRTLVECDAVCPAAGDGQGSIIEERPSSGHLVLKVNTQNPQLLVVSENNLPGWTVLVDGEEVKPFIANGSFFGIPVAASEHTVELRFSYWRILSEAFGG